MNFSDYYEAIGLVASVLVAISLMMSSLVKLRWLNLVGSVIFSVYGILIHSLSVAAVNIFIVGVNIVHLYGIYRKKEAFRVAFVHSEENDYLTDFLEYYHDDIKRFFPRFNFNIEEEYLIMFVHRDLNMAGLIVLEIKDADTLHIVLDYVVPQYRDYKVADYIFKRNTDRFRYLGYNLLYSEVQNTAHNNYLEKIGFVREGDRYVFRMK
jgi:ribosomal protein S18 acetylase RimI-like enzyme